MALRGLVAVALSVLVDLLVWTASSKHLTGHIDIVGYPTFFDFDYLTLFLSYRLVTYAFPAGVIVFYLLLAWRGPLRGHRSVGPKIAVPLNPAHDSPVGVSRDVEVLSPTAAGSPPLSLLWGPLSPALAVVLVASVAGRQVHPTIGWLSVACGCLYFLIVFALAWLVVLTTPRRGGDGTAIFRHALCVVNAIAEPAVAFGGLWFVSRHTEALMTDRSVHRWAWLPWWLAAAGIAAAWLWVALQLRRGRSAPITEQRLRVVLIGSAVIYLLVALIPQGLGYFQGFDDSQGLTGAFLLQHGYFPWRDFQFIHGFFADAVESLVGFHIFGETVWGSSAGIGLILLPLSWVSLYLLAAWGARRGTLVILAPLVFAASGSLAIDPRFIVLPLMWVLLGKALASQRPRWTYALAVALFIEAVVIPEADFQVVAVFAVLLAADLVHRAPGAPLRIALRRTLNFVMAGAALVIVWLGFLASQHALAAYVDWFTIFVQGHDATGAIPTNGTEGFLRTMFDLMIVLVVLTVLNAAWRVHQRRSWTPLAWVTLAAAINAGIYGEQAIGRFDAAHVQYSLDVALPLFVLVAVSVLPAVDQLLVAVWTRARGVSLQTVGLGQPVTVAAIVAVILLVPAVKTNFLHVPSRTRTRIAPQAAPTPRFGYTAPGISLNSELSDWRSVLDTYASKSAPFLDMTNSPGYFYFLLAKRPASALTNISQAIPEGSQQIMISDLRRSRPPLVAFNSSTIGLPVWDQVQNEVRSFEVSQFVLDGWTPLVETHGVLFLLRNDLVSHRPPIPRLTQAPVTSDLYSSAGVCNWGDAANFLDSQPQGRSVMLHAERLPNRREISITGWSFEPKQRAFPKQVIVVVGNQIVATGPIGAPSPQIGARFHSRAAATSGFVFRFATTLPGAVSVYVITAGNAVHPVAAAGFPLGRPLRRIQFPGAMVAVRPAPIGAITVMTSKKLYVSEFNVPPGGNVTGFDLATFISGRTIGDAELTLSQDDGADLGLLNGTAIVANTLPLAGSQIAVRVGSCLSWHGYTAGPLYLAQEGGTPITKLELSGVKT